jgi:hypothetical protein
MKNNLSKTYATTAIIAIATIAGLFASTITPAMAASPHFIKSATTAQRSGDNLVCFFKEAGLGSFATVTITCSATATRVDSCVNNGGNIPKDPKKTTTVARTSNTGTFTVDKSGNVQDTLTLSPPATTLTCPSGQTATLISLSYTNVQVVDSTSGQSFNIPGTF